MEQTPIVEEDRESIFSTMARNGLKVVGKGASNILKAFTRYKGRPRQRRVPQQVAVNNVLPQQRNVPMTYNSFIPNPENIDIMKARRLQFWNT